jgi:hypothetical protein
MYGIPVLLRPKKKANHVSSSYRPRIDELEERCCPDGSHVTLNALVLPGHLVQLSGTVTGGQVAGLQLQFTGAVSGVTTTDTNGNFSYTTSQASLGTVYAAGFSDAQTTDTDTNGNYTTSQASLGTVYAAGLSNAKSTDTAQATIAVAAPVLSLSISYGSQHNVTLSGQLTDLDAGSGSVSISGVAGGTAVTDSSGNFSLTTMASALGEVDATATDAWGQASNIATVMVSDTAPVIQNFAVIRGAGNTWTFQGSVVTGYAEGLVVTFGGHSSIAEQTAIVGADGTFSVTLTLPPGAYFCASAITTDWWGLDSDPVYYPVG